MCECGSSISLNQNTHACRVKLLSPSSTQIHHKPIACLPHRKPHANAKKWNEKRSLWKIERFVRRGNSASWLQFAECEQQCYDSIGLLSVCMRVAHSGIELFANKRDGSSKIQVNIPITFILIILTAFRSRVDMWSSKWIFRMRRRRVSTSPMWLSTIASRNVCRNTTVIWVSLPYDSVWSANTPMNRRE